MTQLAGLVPAVAVYMGRMCTGKAVCKRHRSYESAMPAREDHIEYTIADLGILYVDVGSGLSGLLVLGC